MQSERQEIEVTAAPSERSADTATPPDDATPTVTTPTDPTLGRMLRAARGRARLRPWGIARHTGIPVELLAKIERDEAVPSSVQLDALLLVLEPVAATGTAIRRAWAVARDRLLDTLMTLVAGPEPRLLSVDERIRSDDRAAAVRYRILPPPPPVEPCPDRASWAGRLGRGRAEAQMREAAAELVRLGQPDAGDADELRRWRVALEIANAEIFAEAKHWLDVDAAGVTTEGQLFVRRGHDVHTADYRPCISTTEQLRDLVDELNERDRQWMRVEGDAPGDKPFADDAGAVSTTAVPTPARRGLERVRRVNGRRRRAAAAKRTP